MTTDKTDNIDKQEVEEQEEVKFTQADIDNAVKSRLSREAKATKALEDELNDLKAKLEAQPEVNEVEADVDVDGTKEDIVEEDIVEEDVEKKALEAKVEKLESMYQKERVDNAIKLELTKANARNLKAVQALMDMDTVEEQEDGSFKGITEAIESLKESDPYLFDLGTATQGKATVAGNPNRKSEEKPNAFKDVFGRYM